ncbi:hypothetical protein HK097_001210 [Rhizophlyctis rosea]|uniref:Large ribosomal subunit protein uL23m n=1 Tax=Rhizophlyctis rosea TaxID=64517 RepID=A0AAD5X7H1_9FUNG|nr:hypothetical protein HK097_001210 [Rhizophlyctis rosea]
MGFKLLPGTTYYFPNFVVQLLRSNLPPHQAAFRVPTFLNKIDIRSFLSQTYNIQITDVRTMVYLGREYVAKHRVSAARKTRLPSWKKAIVTMEEDFKFPPPPEIRKHGTGSAEEPGALKLPPLGGPGKSSGKRYRFKLPGWHEMQKKQREEKAALQKSGGSS